MKGCAAVTCNVEHAAHNVGNTVGQIHGPNLAHKRPLRLQLVGEHVQLAVQKRFNGRNRRLSLNNVTGGGNFVWDVVGAQPGRDSGDFRLRGLYDVRNLVNIEVLPVAR